MAKEQRLKQSHLPNTDAEEDDVIIDDGGVTVNLDDEERRAADAERRTKKGGEDRDKDGGKRVAGLEEEEARAESERAAEERRQARRQERREKKDDQAEREARKDREIAELRTRVNDHDAKLAVDFVGEARATVANIDREMATLEKQYTDARALKQRALENKDAAAAAEVAKAAVEADEAMLAARERHMQLGYQREDTIRNAQAEARRPKVSAELKAHAKAFTDEHSWYKAGSGDRDSEQVAALDRQMAAEGWNPNTAGYWEELRDRVKDKLPHRFGGADDDRDEDPAPQRRQRVGGSGREVGGGGGGNTFHLSRARVDALREAGMWDDPVKRNKMIKMYRERDAQDARNRQQGK